MQYSNLLNKVLKTSEENKPLYQLHQNIQRLETVKEACAILKQD
jgi:hypothetical protein